MLRMKSRDFAIRIIKLYKLLREERQEYVMAKQMLRSGTSIGANISEGIYAESRSDLIHKYAIAQKECSETCYWLDLLHSTEFMTTKEFQSMNADCVELIKILTAAIITLKKSPPIIPIPNT